MAHSLEKNLKMPRRVGLLPLIVCISVAGCGGSSDRPELGEVIGTVTLDGEPLANAVVMFKPKGKRPSRGFTNANGHYKLAYIRDILGATTGKHRVIIDRVPKHEGKSYQKLPSRYNSATTLEAVVEPGENVLNWTLVSKNS